ncbi:unnamed protein product [Gulo gulo]|uniref:Uncharacterized protein n=1 Tax=Gulo gulo TaxID=48420 RepID=A0A9X9LZP8_GULGU|nr:unnamed protein product [Gulo gulo]
MASQGWEYISLRIPHNPARSAPPASPHPPVPGIQSFFRSFSGWVQPENMLCLVPLGRAGLPATCEP